VDTDKNQCDIENILIKPEIIRFKYRIKDNNGKRDIYKNDDLLENGNGLDYAIKNIKLYYNKFKNYWFI